MSDSWSSLPRALTWDALEVEHVLPGITRQTVDGERQTVVRYVYEPGSVFPEHHHAQEQITLVVRGSIRFTVAGQIIDLGPGGIAVIPPDAPHGAVVVGDETVETFNTLCPRRASAPSFSS